MSAFFNALQFGTPLALFGLLALPIIWWLLRFTPPRPRQIAFPPVRILLGLPKQQETPDKTPWWLLLLRLLLAALLILAVAQPFLQPKGNNALPQGHRLIIVDNGWAAAKDWDQRRDFLLSLLEQARVEGTPISLVSTAPTTEALGELSIAPRDSLDKARLLKPSPLTPDRLALLAKLEAAKPKDIQSIIWLADGLLGADATSFAEGLKTLAPSVTLHILAPEAKSLPHALGPIAIAGNDIKLTVFQPQGATGTPISLAVRAINGRSLLDVPVEFAGGTSKDVTFTLPTSLRNEIQSIAITDEDHAGARQLFDDRWRRRTIALQAQETNEQAQPLLSPLHYLRRGLEPFAELFEPQSNEELSALIDAGLSMLVLADIGNLPEEQVTRLQGWVEKGGILLRFAGPHLAASTDTLLPVTLRAGDRTLGSALSWDVPQGLAAFPDTSPFAGLVLDPSIKVTRQVLAEPDAEIANRTWASLEDGTPLVTAEKRGKGLIVLVHVTANASWSNLPLSGLFLQMLQRIAGLDPQATATTVSEAQVNATPRMLLNGRGDLAPADGSAQPVLAAAFDKTIASALHPPGIYLHQGRELALNLKLDGQSLTPMPSNLAGINNASYSAEPRRDLAPLLFALAAGFFLADTLATLLLGGGLTRTKTAIASLALLLMFTPLPHAALAQSTAPTEISEADIAAALQTRLAYVETGDAALDEASKQGLRGLTVFLTDRTSANLAEPNGVNIERDEVVFYPLLYWPVPDNAEPLSETARVKVAAYMKNGGTIFFDTRDGGVDANGGNQSLQRLLQNLDLPPLEPVPAQHVLTRSFYLLDRFPGRYEGPAPWVESRVGESSDDPGTADGVSSIIIGSNDYAAAWAIDDNGSPLYAVAPGTDRQREFAVRAGINVVMYALTGNYKADQVHVPAFLERLGQ